MHMAARCGLASGQRSAFPTGVFRCHCFYALTRRISFYSGRFSCGRKIFLKKSLIPKIRFQPLAATDLFTVSIVLASPECHVVGVMQHVAFSLSF